MLLCTVPCILRDDRAEKLKRKARGNVRPKNERKAKLEDNPVCPEMFFVKKLPPSKAFYDIERKQNACRIFHFPKLKCYEFPGKSS